MLGSFYHQTERTSEEQFRRDFGEYPPKPLNDARVQGSLIISHVRGFGKLKYYWTRSGQYLHVLETEPERIAPTFLHMLSPYINLAPQLPTSKQLGEKQYTFRMPRVLIRAGFIYCMYKVESASDRRLGYVLPIVKNDNHLTILGRTKKTSDKFEALITHEHIHVQQHKNAEQRESKTSHPELVLPANLTRDLSALYILDRLEMEARLHEVVIHHYRSAQPLPRTQEEFLQLVTHVDLTTFKSAESTKSASITHSAAPARSGMFIDQFFNLLYTLKDNETRERFISEVLSVMYGNLLGYYGDQEASALWQSQIARPNLYDALYPLIKEEPVFASAL